MAVLLNDEHGIAEREESELLALGRLVRLADQFASSEARNHHEQRGFHLAYSNAALDVGIQFDKLIPLKNRRWDCPQNTRYLTLGLRAGYIVNPAVKGRFNGNIVEGAPTWSPGGPYLKLVIGFSTKMRDLKWKK